MSIAGVERTPAIVVASEAYADRLEAIWKNKRGLAGFFSTVDHKEIGIRYIVTAFGFLALGGVEVINHAPPTGATEPASPHP